MQTHEAAQHTSATVQPPAVCVALCVDDYGLHEGVNRAVGELAALGRVQATSAMVGGAAWASGLALLRQLDPAQVQVGLHLDHASLPSSVTSSQRFSLDFGAHSRIATV